MNYDLIIIGSGPGGYVAAIKAGQLGLKTAIIEKDPYLGGTCLNVGCIPSKALLHTTEQVSFIKNDSLEHGIEVSDLKMDLSKMHDRRRSIVQNMRKGVDGFVSGRGVDIIYGHGSLLGDGKVRVFQKEAPIDLEAKSILIATGSVPVELPFLSFDGNHVISSTEALELMDVPEKMLVIGGGAIGLEMGSVWNRLGSEVTVVEFLPNIAAGSDTDVSKTALRIFQKQGLKIHTSTKVTEGIVSGDKVIIKAEDKKGKELQFEVDKVLVSVGRKAFTEGLGAEAAGVDLDDKGRITVDESFQSSAKGIYAIGDAIDGPMLAHKAEEEGVAFVEKLVTGYGHINYDLIPNVIYTDPEIASVGLTETAAKEKYGKVKIGKFNVGANGRAIATGHNHGIVKVIAHEETDKILGVHIVGSHASELIASAVGHMEYGGSAEDLARTVHAHPTISESIKEAALDVDGNAIHALSRKR